MATDFGFISKLVMKVNGEKKTDAGSPLALVGRGGLREKPGFTPNEIIAGNPTAKSNKSGGYSNETWFGVLLENHPDYSAEKNKMSEPLSTSQRFDLSKSFPNFKDETPDPARFYSTRDTYILFGDTSTDYFKHGLHVIDNKTPHRSEKNLRETWDGSEQSTPLRLSQFTTTPYENNDPVIFGFDLIIDAVSSPLLNGSVEDFIDQFSRISEVASKKNVLIDFKQQFEKIFKTKGTIKKQPATQRTLSIVNPNYANQDAQTNIFTGGKKAYLSYYLKKVAGLEFLQESNQPSKKKYSVDYRNDLIKLTFSEDVSASLGTLAYLYKLLYWSKPNGKNIIPENLLRFNCDIVISEVRNLNRVRKAVDTGSLEVIKENVSRYIYSLKECQFWFDTPPHDVEVDLSGTKDYDNFTVTMDFKYVSSKFERWVPDQQGFGLYVGYNSGAMWKVGNKGAREAFGASQSEKSGTVKDVSVPKFFTISSNTLKQNGVAAPITLKSFNPSFGMIEPEVVKTKEEATKEVEKPAGESSGNKSDESSTGDTGDLSDADQDKAEKKAKRKASIKAGFETFKKSSSAAAVKLAKNLDKAVRSELQGQINERFRLLNSTIDKIRNQALTGRNLPEFAKPFFAAGLGRMRAPTNIYRIPESERAHIDSTANSRNPDTWRGAVYGSGTIEGVSPQFYDSVNNSIRQFVGESLGSVFTGVLGNFIRGL